MAGLSRLPLNALRVFESAARTGSFLKAADELSITPGAVSRHIKRLEADLGVRLFQRFNRAVRLTDVGAELAKGVHDGLLRVLDSVERARPEADGPLVVSTTISIAGRWLTPRLQQFLDANPDIEVAVTVSDRAVDLATEGVDVALRFGRGPFPGLHAERLIRNRVFPVCSPALAGELGLRSPADLARAILFQEVLPTGWIEPEWTDWFAVCGLEAPVGRRGPSFSNTFLALEAAKSGRGVVLTHEALVLDDLASGQLVRLFDQTLESPHSYWIVCLPERAHRPPVRRFRRWLIERAKADGVFAVD
jgi:LysR family glycine cleavage system transcriptional activator